MQKRNYLAEPIKEITEERFMYMLEVLPPFRWHRYSQSESFLMSEFQTDDITEMFVRVGTRYFSLFVEAGGNSLLRHEAVVQRITEEFGL